MTMRSPKIFSFESLPTTTEKAIELIQMGEKAPFYITCLIQTKGRGTHENSWKSPKGGIYLQAVYPFPHKNPLRITQKVSLSLARWVLQVTGKKIIIKWPNDLTWKGRKLGGILCEKQSHHGKSYLSVGIGINVLVTPEDRYFPYHTTSLKEMNESLPSLSELKNSLIHYFQEDFLTLLNSPDLEDFEEFFMKKRTLWHKKGSFEDFFYYKGMSSEGFLHLENQEGKSFTLKSAQNPYTWYFLDTKDSEKPLLKLEKQTQKFFLHSFKDFRQKEPDSSWELVEATIRQTGLSKTVAEIQRQEGLTSVPVLW